MAGDVPWGEAFAAMMAMMIVLVFVLIYYCVMPIYHGMRRRKLMREEAWEHDPRWAGDQFKFTPKRPDNFLTDKKYSRLAACSRSSSIRSNLAAAGNDNCPTLALNESLEANLEVGTGVASPPMYSDLFQSTGSSLASTPPLYSSKTPSVEISSSNEMMAPTIAKPPKIMKPKKNRKAKIEGQPDQGVVDCKPAEEQQ